MDQEESPSHSRHKDSSDNCSQIDSKVNDSKIENNAGGHPQEFRVIQNDSNSNVI